MEKRKYEILPFILTGCRYCGRDFFSFIFYIFQQIEGKRIFGSGDTYKLSDIVYRRHTYGRVP